MKKQVIEKIKNLAAGTLSILVFVVLWHFATNGTQLGKLMPGPSEVIVDFFASFTNKIGDLTILGHVGWSLSRVLVAYVAAAFAAIILGLTMGWYKVVDAIARPIFETIRPIPPIAWISLAILWFGLGELPKFFIIFIAVFTDIVINAYAGVKSVDKKLVGAAKMLGASDRQVFTSIVVPAAVPHIFAGLQIALASSLSVLLAAEMVRSTEGLGWIIINGMAVNDTSQIFVGIISIGILGFLLSIVMRGVEDKLCRWNK